MERQARKIAGWGDNVYVKIPITNTEGVSSLDLVRRLTGDGVQLNITALLTNEQVDATAVLEGGSPPSCRCSRAYRRHRPRAGADHDPGARGAAPAARRRADLGQPREVLNIAQADRIGCHVITVTPDLLAKLGLFGKDLGEFSLDTVACSTAARPRRVHAVSDTPVGSPAPEVVERDDWDTLEELRRGGIPQPRPVVPAPGGARPPRQGR